MKILTSSQIRQADAYTIENEPIASVNLMERAALRCFEWISVKIDKSRKIHVVCGLGNNGGDGLVIARMLSISGYDVAVCILKHAEKSSGDFKKNYERLKKINNIFIAEISAAAEFSGIKKMMLLLMPFSVPD